MNNLKIARFWLGLSQWEVARRSGVPQGKLTLLERNYLKAKPEEKKALAKVLGWKVEELFPEG